MNTYNHIKLFIYFLFVKEMKAARTTNLNDDSHVAQLNTRG